MIFSEWSSSSFNVFSFSNDLIFVMSSVGVKGLADKIVGPGFDALDFGLSVRKGGKQDYTGKNVFPTFPSGFCRVQSHR